MKIYLASSWRNLLQPKLLNVLRTAGHEVYDFRQPEPNVSGFSWAEIDPKWETWTSGEYREALKSDIAKRGYSYDINALNTCEAAIYVLPCGKSASWELGYAMGQGKKGYVIALDKCDPELMFREAKIIVSMEEFFDEFGGHSEK